MPCQRLRISEITADPVIHPRSHIDKGILLSYVDDLRTGANFPRILVFKDKEGRHWLAEGFYRVQAVERLGRKEIDAEVRTGSRQDALLQAAGANTEHGLRRSQWDKRKIVRSLLEDPKIRKWSSRRIAKAARVSHTYVDNVKKALCGNVARCGEPQTVYMKVFRGETEYDMKPRTVHMRIQSVDELESTKVDPSVLANDHFQQALREVARNLKAKFPEITEQHDLALEIFVSTWILKSRFAGITKQQAERFASEIFDEMWND